MTLLLNIVYGGALLVLVLLMWGLITEGLRDPEEERLPESAMDRLRREQRTGGSR